MEILTWMSQILCTGDELFSNKIKIGHIEINYRSLMADEGIIMKLGIFEKIKKIRNLAKLENLGNFSYDDVNMTWGAHVS
jgi:hypothetical protein